MRSDDAAATGPCGHGKVEISDPLRRYLPHEARRGPPQNLFGGLGKIGLPKWAINDPSGDGFIGGAKRQDRQDQELK